MSKLLKKILYAVRLQTRLFMYAVTNKELLIHLIQENDGSLVLNGLSERTKTILNGISVIQLNSNTLIYPKIITGLVDDKKFLKKARKYGVLKKMVISVGEHIDDNLNRYLENLLEQLDNQIQIIWLPLSLQNLSGYHNLPMPFRVNKPQQMSLMPIDKNLIHSEANPYLRGLIQLIENSDPDQVTSKQFEYFWQYFYTLLEQCRTVYEYSKAYNALNHFVLINGELNEEVLTQITHAKLLANKTTSWRLQSVKYVFLSIIVGCFIFSTGNSYYKNHTALKEIYDAGHALNLQDKQFNYYSIQALYPDKVDMHFGLYQGNKLNKKLQTWYQNIIKEYYLPEFITMAKLNVQNCIATECSDPTSKFKMYMMLVKPSHFNANFFFDQLTTEQKNSFPNNQLVPTLKFMQQFRFQAIAPDPTLDAQIITYLPSVTYAANQLINAEALNLSVVSPFSDVGYLQNSQNLNVPTLYTSRGYSAYLAFKAATLNNAGTLFWYYPSVNSQFQQTLATALDDAYVKHYLSSWHKLLKSMQIYPVDNVFDEVATLNLMDKNSIHNLLKTLANYALITDVNTPIATQINSQFAGLKALADNANFKQIINKNFSALNALLTKLNTSQPQDLFQFMSAAINNGSITELADLKRTNQQLPKILQPFLAKFIHQTSQNLFNKLIPGLNTQWQHIVPDINQMLMTTYPFAANPVQDSSMDQWQQLFGKDSTLINYLSQNIAPFINLTTGAPYKLYGASLPLIPSVISKLVSYQQLNQTFFANNSLMINFALQPVNLSSSIPRIKLTLLGQGLVYQHGPLLKKVFQFPKNNVTSSITWSSFTGDDNVTQQLGTWSWLKLLLAANPVKLDTNLWQLTFTEDSNVFVVNLTGNPAVDILLNGSLHNLTLPRSLK